MRYRKNMRTKRSIVLVSGQWSRIASLNVIYRHIVIRRGRSQEQLLHHLSSPEGETKRRYINAVEIFAPVFTARYPIPWLLEHLKLLQLAARNMTTFIARWAGDGFTGYREELRPVFGSLPPGLKHFMWVNPKNMGDSRIFHCFGKIFTRLPACLETLSISNVMTMWSNTSFPLLKSARSEQMQYPLNDKLDGIQMPVLRHLNICEKFLARCRPKTWTRLDTHLISLTIRAQNYANDDQWNHLLQHVFTGLASLQHLTIEDLVFTRMPLSVDALRQLRLFRILSRHIFIEGRFALHQEQKALQDAVQRLPDLLRAFPRSNISSCRARWKCMLLPGYETIIAVDIRSPMLCLNIFCRLYHKSILTSSQLANQKSRRPA
jgi:hypothetical protein